MNNTIDFISKKIIKIKKFHLPTNFAQGLNVYLDK